MTQSFLTAADVCSLLVYRSDVLSLPRQDLFAREMIHPPTANNIFDRDENMIRPPNIYRTVTSSHFLVDWWFAMWTNDLRPATRPSAMQRGPFSNYDRPLEVTTDDGGRGWEEEQKHTLFKLVNLQILNKYWPSIFRDVLILVHEIIGWNLDYF